MRARQDGVQTVRVGAPSDERAARKALSSKQVTASSRLIIIGTTFA